MLELSSPGTTSQMHNSLWTLRLGRFFHSFSFDTRFRVALRLHRGGQENVLMGSAPSASRSSPQQHGAPAEPSVHSG